MAFNPQEHMINMASYGKPPRLYLETKWRLVWFRDEHPNGSVQSEVLSYEPLVVRASVYSEGGVLLATGHGSAKVTGQKVVWSGREIEKAETAAIGRALAHAGYGSQFDPDSDEGEDLADSPIQRVGGNAPQSHQEADTGVSSPTPAQSTTPPQPTAQSAKSALGTPNGQRMGSASFPMGDFKNRCLKDIYANNTIHMNKSLDKLIKAGLLNYDSMTLEQAYEVVRTRKEVDIPA